MLLKNPDYTQNSARPMWPLRSSRRNPRRSGARVRPAPAAPAKLRRRKEWNPPTPPPCQSRDKNGGRLPKYRHPAEGKSFPLWKNK